MLSTVWQYVFLAFSVLSLVVSFFAIQLALRHVREERDYRSLLMWVQELEDLHEALNASHKRLRSRVGMRELREKRKTNGEDPHPPQSTDEEAAKWKKEMRLKLHRGELKAR